MVAIAMHVTALLLDSYAHVTVGSLFGLGPSFAVTLGAIAFWLAIGLPLSLPAPPGEVHLVPRLAQDPLVRLRHLGR